MDCTHILRGRCPLTIIKGYAPAAGVIAVAWWIGIGTALLLGVAFLIAGYEEDVGLPGVRLMADIPDVRQLCSHPNPSPNPIS